MNNNVMNLSYARIDLSKQLYELTNVKSLFWYVSFRDEIVVQRYLRTRNDGSIETSPTVNAQAICPAYDLGFLLRLVSREILTNSEIDNAEHVINFTSSINLYYNHKKWVSAYYEKNKLVRWSEGNSSPEDVVCNLLIELIRHDEISV